MRRTPGGVSRSRSRTVPCGSSRGTVRPDALAACRTALVTGGGTGPGRVIRVELSPFPCEEKHDQQVHRVDRRLPRSGGARGILVRGPGIHGDRPERGPGRDRLLGPDRRGRPGPPDAADPGVHPGPRGQVRQEPAPPRRQSDRPQHRGRGDQAARPRGDQGGRGPGTGAELGGHGRPRGQTSSTSCAPSRRSLGMRPPLVRRTPPESGSLRPPLRPAGAGDRTERALSRPGRPRRGARA